MFVTVLAHLNAQLVCVAVITVLIAVKARLYRIYSRVRMSHTCAEAIKSANTLPDTHGVNVHLRRRLSARTLFLFKSNFSLSTREFNRVSAFLMLELVS